MSHNYPTGSKGNCVPVPVDGDNDLTVAGDAPRMLDQRGKAPKGDRDRGPEERSKPGGAGHVTSEAGPDDALAEFTASKAGGRYGGATNTVADIPLSSNGPETRDGA